MTVNERLIQIIAYTNLSTEDFARRIGQHSQTIYNIVGGRMGNPSYDTLHKISEGFPEIDIDWLVTGRGVMIHETTKQDVPTRQEENTERLKEKIENLKSMLESQKFALSAQETTIAYLKQDKQKMEQKIK